MSRLVCSRCRSWSRCSRSCSGYVLTTYPVFGKFCCRRSFSRTRSTWRARSCWFATGVIRKHLWVTLIESILAFVIGSVSGVLVGFWFARQPRTAAVFDPYVKAVNALPRVVLAPIFTLWLGLGIWSKVALGVTLVFLIVFFNVYQASRKSADSARQCPHARDERAATDAPRLLGRRRLSWMFSSLHNLSGLCRGGRGGGRISGCGRRAGYLIQQAEGVFDVAGVFAACLCWPPSCSSSTCSSPWLRSACWSAARDRRSEALATACLLAYRPDELAF